MAFVEGGEREQQAFVADAHAAYRREADRYGLRWDGTAVLLFAAESAETLRILCERGVRFGPRSMRAGHSSDRLRTALVPSDLARAFAAEFASPSIRTLVQVRAESLLLVSGRVVGVRARRGPGGLPLTVNARRAVILATGGYQAGQGLRALHRPDIPVDVPWYGLGHCRGDGHRMGAAIGAELVNMTYLPPAVLVPSSLVEAAIAVNACGVRFHDETGPFRERVAALQAQPGRLGFYLLPESVARQQTRLIAQLPRPPLRAQDPEALAADLKLPWTGLRHTLGLWNRFLASGQQRDPQFGRLVPPQARLPLQGPLLALPMVEGVNISCGGFRTTAQMQVLDCCGRVIPGLFAAGDTTAGLNVAASMLGLHISGALTQGRIAGRAAADVPLHELAAAAAGSAC